MQTKVPWFISIPSSWWRDFLFRNVVLCCMYIVWMIGMITYFESLLNSICAWKSVCSLIMSLDCVFFHLCMYCTNILSVLFILNYRDVDRKFLLCVGPIRYYQFCEFCKCLMCVAKLDAGFIFFTYHYFVCVLIRWRYLCQFGTCKILGRPSMGFYL